MKRKWTALWVSISMLAGCTGNGGGDINRGTKIEDAHNKDMQLSSPLPNGSPNTPPSEISASPNGASQGSTPQF